MHRYFRDLVTLLGKHAQSYNHIISSILCSFNYF